MIKLKLQIFMPVLVALILLYELLLRLTDQCKVTILVKVVIGL